METRLTCTLCGEHMIIASGYIALAMTDLKKQNIADKIGWQLNPEVCPECAKEASRAAISDLSDRSGRGGQA